MTWVIPPVRGLIDPNCAPTFHIDDIGAIWLENGEATVYYYRRQPCLHGGEDQLVTDVIIKRQGKGLVQSFAKVATFAQAFLFGGGAGDQHPPPVEFPPRGGKPTLVP